MVKNMKNLINCLDLEAYNYDLEEQNCRQRTARKAAPKKNKAREDQKRSEEAKEASKLARYSAEQIVAKKQANKEIAEKTAMLNKQKIAAKKREENGGSYRFKSKKSKSDYRKSR